MIENSIFVITAPDMQLLENGPSVTVITSDSDFLDKVETMYEGMFNTLPVNIYWTNGDITDNNLAWAVSVFNLSDVIFVDLNTISDFTIAATLCYLDSGNFAYIDTENKRPDVAKLFNTLRDGPVVFETLQAYQILSLGVTE